MITQQELRFKRESGSGIPTRVPRCKHDALRQPLTLRICRNKSVTCSAHQRTRVWTRLWRADGANARKSKLVALVLEKLLVSCQSLAVDSAKSFWSSSIRQTKLDDQIPHSRGWIFLEQWPARAISIDTGTLTRYETYQEWLEFIIVWSQPYIAGHNNLWIYTEYPVKV